MRAVDAKAPGLKRVNQLHVSLETISTHATDSVTKNVEGTFGGYPGVQLPERSGRGVAWVGKSREPPLFPNPVEAVIDLPPYLQEIGHRRPP